jgi:hypothetical protein
MARVTISSNNLFPGPRGAQGPKGETGNTGAAGSSGVVSVTSPITNVGSETAAVIGINTANFALLNTANSFTNSPQTITTASASTIGLIVNATASQSVNLTEWRNSTGTVIARVNQSGDVFGRLLFAFTSTNFSASLNVGTASAGSIGAVIRGAASQTANLQQWQNSAGTVIGGVAANGAAFFGTTGATNASLTSIPTAASVSGIIVRAAASQTANLQEWQDSTGTRLSSFDSSGYLRVRNAPTGDFAASIGATYSGNIPLVLRGASGQTADLQQWQNSAGTVLSRIDSAGVYTGTVLTANGYIRLSEQNSGGRLRIVKATAAVTNPGTDRAEIYFRDGTNAGTLKLVVRAGTAGAETTILDNIPQT